MSGVFLPPLHPSPRHTRAPQNPIFRSGGGPGLDPQVSACGLRGWVRGVSGHGVCSRGSCLDSTLCAPPPRCPRPTEPLFVGSFHGGPFTGSDGVPPPQRLLRLSVPLPPTVPPRRRRPPHRRRLVVVPSSRSSTHGLASSFQTCGRLGPPPRRGLRLCPYPPTTVAPSLLAASCPDVILSPAPCVCAGDGLPSAPTPPPTFGVGSPWGAWCSCRPGGRSPWCARCRAPLLVSSPPSLALSPLQVGVGVTPPLHDFALPRPPPRSDDHQFGACGPFGVGAGRECYSELQPLFGIFC